MIPKDKDFDKKIFRLISILNRLSGEGRVFSRELSNEFNVSMRTIQRDLELLNMTGFLLDSPEKGTYRFAEGFSLKKMKLTSDEASLLTVLYEITKSLGNRFEGSFRNILTKVLSQEFDSPFYIKMPDSIKIPKDYPFMRDLESAIDDCRKISIHYKSHDKEKDYKICPLKIIFFDGFWYLLANPDSKNWLIKFRLENIQSLESVEGHFTPPRNLKSILDESVNIFFPDKRDKKVVLKIDVEAARYFRKRTYFPLQKIKRVHQDGSLTVETRVAQLMEIMPVVLRWIPHVVVEIPKDFRDEVEKIVAGYLKKI